MNRLTRAWILASLLSVPSLADDWSEGSLFKASPGEQFLRDKEINMTTGMRASVAELRKKASVEQRPALQIGVLHGSVTQKETSHRWYGNLKVTVAADYSATYGLPYDLIEKGIRIEKDYTTTGLYVVVTAPIPLSVSVNPGSVRVEKRDRNGIRTWSDVHKLQLRSQQYMQVQAHREAAERCSGHAVREMTRCVVRDMVLDLAGELYSRQAKRALATRTIVVFSDELKSHELRRRTTPPTSSEIDSSKSGKSGTRYH